MSNSSIPRLVVLISGSGTNLQAILDATQSGALKARVALVVSNRAGAYGLERAKAVGVPTLVQSLKSFRAATHPDASREEYDASLAKDILTKLSIEEKEEKEASTTPSPFLLVLAGFMHILSPAFLDHFPNQVINLHPALPGQFDGAKAIERAYEAYKAGTIESTGVMVHYVIPEVDRGQPILTRSIPILPEDSLEDLEARMHNVEHQVIIEGIAKALEDKQREADSKK
ncbi:MAG: phosphoribosylglycinamide formyltransferase [Piptocephalis tieghemiana]|nr:MAG: phosphoribosylglycinamide formyltransferase [Piptocephalis tieghemiana]